MGSLKNYNYQIIPTPHPFTPPLLTPYQKNHTLLTYYFNHRLTSAQISGWLVSLD